MIHNADIYFRRDIDSSVSAADALAESHYSFKNQVLDGMPLKYLRPNSVDKSLNNMVIGVSPNEFFSTGVKPKN